MSVGRVFQINVNPDGGVPKRPVPRTWLRVDGVEGDKQRMLQFHGGPNRAVSLFAKERIEALAAEGHPIFPGSTGENVTVEGLDWDQVVPGVRLRIGAALLEVASYTSPCKTIRRSFADDDFTRMAQKLHPGWSRVYARVLEEAEIHQGDLVELLGQGALPL